MTKIEKINQRLVKVGSEREYSILTSYHGTYIEKQMKLEESLLFPYFRVFIPAKPEKGRKLNTEVSHNFDIYNDSLLDYASIIGYKLNKPWELFNRLISVQIPYCLNDCWHCYLPKELYSSEKERCQYLTAKQIIDDFLKQREHDAKQGKYSNVLRITGGEPFYVPELILDCLTIIAEKGLEKEIFLWTETNLTPFIDEDNSGSFITKSRSKILSEIGKFRNIAVHPCFHGLNSQEYNIITNNGSYIIEDLLKAVRTLFHIGIDIYPTFGSNVCNPSKLSDLFFGLKKIDATLPLKVALINYDLEYEPIKFRAVTRKPQLYSKYASIRIWNQLLIDSYGIGYGILPRHLNTLSILVQPFKDIQYFDDIIYFFKSSLRMLYHREVLDILAMPIGSSLEVEYDAKWIQKDLLTHMTYLPELYNERTGVFLYTDQKINELLPLRTVVIKKVEVNGNIVKFNLLINEYISLDKDKISVFTTSLRNYFGKLSLPQNTQNKYVLIGEPFQINGKTNSVIIDDDEINFGNNFSDVISCFSKYVKAEKSLFYRVKDINLKRDVTDSGNIKYLLPEGSTFKIEFEYYLPNYDKFDESNTKIREVKLDISSNSVKSIGNTYFSLSKYGSKTFLFKSIESGEKEDLSITYYSENIEFEAPRITIPLKILPKSKAKKGLKALITALVLTLGLFFIGVIQADFNNFAKIEENKKEVNVINDQTTATNTKINKDEKKFGLWHTIYEYLKLLFPSRFVGTANALFFFVTILIFTIIYYLNELGYLKKLT